MNEILRRTSMQSGGSIVSNKDPLNKAFSALPLHNQVLALQGGYNSMAKEFNTLAKTVPEITTTVIKPVPVSVELANKFPLLAVEQNGGDKKDSDETSSSNNTGSESSSSSSSVGSVKKISF
jgi:hypothetical protein